ncbi:MAG: DUF4390 domain-containing protein [Acidobacteria bacterium]|nr:DUF4390 domain-containing protein [Acidobacteriota bacterium]
MTPRGLRGIVGVVGLVAVCAATVLAAADIRITPVVAEDRVYANFAASGAFSEPMREAVQSGLPVTLTYIAELRRSSTLWFDDTVAAATVASTVKLDTLTGAYQVSKLRETMVRWAQQTQDEAEMRLWVTEFERVLLGDTSRLKTSGEYYVRVRARDSLPRGFSLWPFGRGEMSGRVELPVNR